MDPVAAIVAILGVIVPAASLLTNIITTPSASAPAWQQALYKLVELLALVGPATKAHPDAVTAIAASIDAARKGDLVTAVAQGTAAYEELAGPAAPPAATSTQIGVAMIAAGFVSMFLLAACSGVTDQGVVYALCQADSRVQPVAVAVAPAAGPEVAAIAAVDQAIVHPAVVAACAGVGQPVGVTAAPAS